VKIADVLVQHLKGPGENTPGETGIRVGVAYGVDVWPGLVDLGVDEKASYICRSRLQPVKKVYAFQT